jgi:hypothetical protein
LVPTFQRNDKQEQTDKERDDSKENSHGVVITVPDIPVVGIVRSFPLGRVEHNNSPDQEDERQ